MIENDDWLSYNIPNASDRVNPASIDVRLGQHIIETKWEGKRGSSGAQVISKQEYNLASGEELELLPNRQYLMCTLENTLCPVTHAWLFTLKSSIARRGLFLSHPGWGDPGFHGQITFSIHVMAPVTVKCGEKIGQLIYMKLVNIPKLDYSETGRYQNSTNVTEERDENGK